MVNIYRFFYCCLLFSLTACQQMAVRDISPPSIDHWLASGKVSVLIDRERYPLAERSQQTLRFNWQQQSEDFVIQLSGNFGFGTTSIRKKGNLVFIERGGEVLDSASDPEQLLLQTTGIKLPISGMRYWILGLASTTGSPNSSNFDPPPLHTRSSLGCDTEECKIQNFQDKGWSIDVRSVHSIDQFILPNRLTASNEGISLKVAVSDWSSTTYGSTL